MENKKALPGLVLLISITILTIFAFMTINKVNNNVWMKDVDDNKLIYDMSIPGTHDSGATHSIADVAGKCQDSSIEEQLKMGVRFFDLRLQMVNDEFKIVHSFVDQKLYFNVVLKDLTNYIKKYNSEFLIISIKEEESPKNSTKDFEELLLHNMSIYNDVICYDEVLPKTLKEARGKIYIMSRYSQTVGIDAYVGWLDSTTFELNDMYIQDYYCVDSVESKKEAIVNTINYVGNKLVLNFTSCYLDSGFPPLYAGTPAKDIHPWLIDYLNDYDGKVGILITDFMTEKLAKAIYERNSI